MLFFIPVSVLFSFQSGDQSSLQNQHSLKYILFLGGALLMFFILSLLSGYLLLYWGTFNGAFSSVSHLQSQVLQAAQKNDISQQLKDLGFEILNDDGLALQAPHAQQFKANINAQFTPQLNTKILDEESYLFYTEDGLVLYVQPGEDGVVDYPQDITELIAHD